MTKSVVRADPAGLLAGGAPEDEYEPEVDDLCALVGMGREAVTAEAVAGVFDRWFGPGVVPPEKAAEVTSRLRHPMAWG